MLRTACCLTKAQTTAVITLLPKNLHFCIEVFGILCTHSFGSISDNVVYFIPGRRQNSLPIRIFSAHAEAARVQYSFEPVNHPFNRPHTIRISKNGRYIYVGELGQNGGRVLQFVINPDWDQVGGVIFVPLRDNENF